MKNFSFSTKIWGLISALTLVIIVITSMSIVDTLTIIEDIDAIDTRILPIDLLTTKISDLQKDIMVVVLLAGNLTTSEATQKAGELVAIYTKGEKLTPRQALEIVDKELDRLIAEVATTLTEIEKYIIRPEVKVAFDNIKRNGEIYIDLSKKAVLAFKEDKNDDALNYLSTVRNETLPELKKYILEINSLTTGNLKETISGANQTAVSSITLGIIISIICIVTVLLLAFFVMRAITKNLLSVVEELSNSSEQVTAASGQIASAAEQLSQSTNEQAASLEETAASVEEINSMIKKNSENADYTASTTKTTKETISQGEHTIDQMTEAMAGISKSTEAMTDIVKVISQIDKKTKVINEIVTKTELLSFNASVEAARAGEHGKGFAVVAEEVGNLARMSGAAAEEISTLLESSTATVNSMVADTKKQVEVGTVVTKQCEEVFGKIVKDIAIVSDKAVEIASASQEQTNGAAEISKAIGQLDVKTQQNASTSEECASAASELLGQAEGLTSIVDNLKIEIYGAKKAQINNMEAFSHKPKKESAKIITMPPKYVSPKQVVKAAPLPKAVPDDVPGYDDGGFTDV